MTTSELNARVARNPSHVAASLSPGFNFDRSSLRAELDPAEEIDEDFDEELPALPIEQYGSIWEAMLAHL